MTATRPSAGAAHTGSTTQLDTTPHPSQVRIPLQVGTLRLRAETLPRRGIRWAEDVVDNEGLGRKSSKVCCIYHKSRAVGESSSEDNSSSSSDSDSDSEPEKSTARKAGDKEKAKHTHDHNEGCRHEGSESGLKNTKNKKRRVKKSPNAYEKLPKRGGTVTQTTK